MKHRLGMVAQGVLLLSVAGTVLADNYSETFDLWPTYTSIGTYTNDQWVVSGGKVTGGLGYGGDGGTQAAWLYPANSYVRSAPLSNGIGQVSFVVKNRTKDTLANIYRLEYRTPADGDWQPGPSFTNSQKAAWVSTSTNLNKYGLCYLRILKTTAEGAAGEELGVDTIAITLPPATVELTGATTLPETPIVGRPIDIEVNAEDLGGASNTIVNAIWRTTGSGPWTTNLMSKVGGTGTLYRIDSSIPAQTEVGTLQFYVSADFDGYNAAPPVQDPTEGESAPYEVSIEFAAFLSGYESMSLAGDLAGSLFPTANFAWQGVYTPAPSVAAPAFTFSGLSTDEVTTVVWGDSSQSSADLPIVEVGEITSDPIQINGTQTNQLVFDFNESNLTYSVRAGAFQDFDTWPATGDYVTSSNAGWLAVNAYINTDAGRKLRGRACYLNSNGTAYVQSKYLSEGIGEISFWYRTWSDSNTTSLSIQKSKTGVGDWVTIDTLTVANEKYARYTTTINDRYYKYVRVINSDSASDDRLCIDELLISQAGAGLVLSGEAVTPASPSVSDPVDLYVTVDEKAGGTLATLTAFYRSRSTGSFIPLPMVLSAGSTYVTDDEVPAAQGSGPEGSGPVDYYFSATCTGYQAELGNPILYPDGGTNNPASFSVREASVTVTNVATVPSQPVTETPTDIEAVLLPDGGAEFVQAVLHYRLPGGNFITIPMEEVSPDLFRTEYAIPGQTVPGISIDYYMDITFSGPGASAVTYPEGGAAAPERFTIGARPPELDYNTMSVVGDFSQSLAPIADHHWRGVVTGLVSQVNPTFLFEGQNGGATQWGDTDQSINELPVFGVANVSTDDIGINETVSGALAFRFHETNLEYDVQQCVYQNFDTWETPYSSSFYLKDSWIIVGGRTSFNGNSEDADRTYGASGRSAFISDYMLSPNLSAGIGEISFRYRNWETNGLTAAAFVVEISPAGLPGTWQEVASNTGILSQDYLVFSVVLSDAASHTVRIRNTGATSLCIDELIITEPGPSVVFSGVTNSPSMPTITNAITISATIVSTNNASSIGGTVWLRSGEPWNFIPVAMTNTAGTHFEAVVPHLAAGTIEYYIEATFQGVSSGEDAHAFFPAQAGTAPLTYDVADVYWLETFSPDDWDVGSTATTQTNDGWIVSEVTVNGSSWGGWGGVDGSPDPAAWLVAVNTNYISYVRTPRIQPRTVVLSFWAKCKKDAIGMYNTLDIEVSTNGSNWNPVASGTITSTEWTYNSFGLDLESPAFVRILKTGNSPSDQLLGLDDVRIALPSAAVTFSDPMIQPGYPAPEDTVHVQSRVFAADGMFQAFDIGASLYYRTRGEPSYSGPVAMRGEGDLFVTTTPIPTNEANATVDYYIESTFMGYAHTDQVSLSPSFYPDGVAAGSDTQYFAPPTNNPASYLVRPFSSEYGSIQVTSTVGVASLELVGLNYWQGVLDLSTVTNEQVAFAFSGLDHYTNGAPSYRETTDLFGDPGQVRFTSPLSSVAEKDAPNILLLANINGQVLFRFNPITGSYLVLRAAYQTFNEWIASSAIFEESLGSDELDSAQITFEGWPTDSDHITEDGTDRERFEEVDGWENLDTWFDDPSTDSKVGWFVQRAMIINESEDNNQAALLKPGVNDGEVWYAPSTATDGINLFSFDARATFEDEAYTYWTVPTNALNYEVKASVTVTDMSPAHPHISVLARFQGVEDYYECRLWQESDNHLRMAIYRQPGDYFIRESGRWYASLIGTHTIQFRSVTNNQGYVLLQAAHNGTDRIVNAYDEDAVVNRILEPGPVGFHSYDCNMTVDNVELRRMDIQRFERWNADYGDHSSAGWNVTASKLNGDHCRLSTSTNATILSPTLAYSPGEITFRYNKGSGHTTNTHITLEGSANNGLSWTTLETLTDFDSWQLHTETGLSSYNRFRIRQHSTNAEALVEDISITENSAWYNEAFTSGAGDWSDPEGAWSWNSGPENYGRPGYLGPDVSFKLRKRALSDPPSQTPEDIPGATGMLDDFTYKYFEFSFEDWESSIIWLRHTTGAANLVVDNFSMTSWRASTHTDTNAVPDSEKWLGNEVWIQDNVCELWRSRADPNTNQSVRTPWLTNGLGTMEFNYKVAEAAHPATFIIEGAATGTPNLFNRRLLTNTVDNTEWQKGSWSFNLSDIVYVRARHTSTNLESQLHLDGIRVTEYREPDESLWRAYNTLITDDPDQYDRALEPIQGRKTCYLNSSFTADTGGLELSEDHPFVASPLLTNGVGEISFWYRNWELSDPATPSTLSIRWAESYDTPGSNWTELITIPDITSTDYQYFTTNLYVPEAKFLRFYNTIQNPVQRLCLDNVLISEPMGADLDIVASDTDPAAPLHTDDNIGLQVILSNLLLDPTDIIVKVYYHLGDTPWGTWTNSEPDSFELRERTDLSSPAARVYHAPSGVGFPQRGIDEVVQYRTVATFDGPFADKASPKTQTTFESPSWYYPTDLNDGHATNTPYYIVFSCPPGTVWINEINYSRRSSEGPIEYVELAGPAGSDIGDWGIEFVGQPPALVVDAVNSATLTNGSTTLPNDENGYGFYVLGDSGVANVDQAFTTVSDQNIARNGGIRLIRSMGAYEHQVSYGDQTWASDMEAYGFEYIAVYKSFSSKTSLTLAGTGSTVSNFTWQLGPLDYYSPGIANTNQFLTGGGTNPPPTSAEIVNFWLDPPKGWIITTGTEAYVPQVRHSTNLMDAGAWTPTTTDTPVYSNGYYTISFDLLTESPIYNYRVVN